VSQEKYFTYRGDVRALAVVGGQVAFVTTHPEGRPTAVYFLDPEKATLSEHPLPAGGRALLEVAGALWVAGTDNRLYHLAPGKPPAVRGGALPGPPIALAPLANDRLAVAAGAQVLVLGRADARQQQVLDLSEPATCLAADPTGQWLAVGTTKGTVAVFECETKPQYQLSDFAALHEAAVTALWFEADELRFLSAGADQKLLSTHARGRLEAEDRGRSANHDEPITAIVAGIAGRFLTGSSDASIKSWPRGQGARPVTLKEGLSKVMSLGVVQVHDKPQVVAACADNSLRFFELDEEGKFGEPTLRIYGVDDWAKYELGQTDPQRRESALRTLADIGDATATRRIAAQMKSDGDPALQLLACRLLGAVPHPTAIRELEDGLKHKHDAVRLAAFEGLVSRAGAGELRPLLLALQAEKADIGRRAIGVLEERAAKDSEALARLTEALDRKTLEVRQAALASLERVHGDSPEPNLVALRSGYADLRRLALLRLYQRKLVHDLRVQAALRWRGEDPDPEVRRLAFLLSLYTRERLLNALRERDAELNRQLTELESGSLKVATEETSADSSAEESPEEPSEAEATAAVAAPAAGPTDLLRTLRSRFDSLVQSGLVAPQMVDYLRRMIEGLQASGDPTTANRILAQLEAFQQQMQQPRPQAGPDPPELAELEKMVQAGKLPRQTLDRMRQMLAAVQGPAREMILRQIAGQIQMLSQMSSRLGRPQPPEPSEEMDEDEMNEDEMDEDME
jgi:ParB family chromosome partitioning protein